MTTQWDSASADPIGDTRRWAQRVKDVPSTAARIAVMHVPYRLVELHGRAAVEAEARLQAQMFGFAGVRVVYVGAPVPFKRSKRCYR